MTKQTTDTRLKLCISVLLICFSPFSLSSENTSDNNSDNNPESPLYSNDDEFVYEEDDDFYADEYSENRFFINIEALLGGSTLERTTFNNGETSSIRAGSGVHLALGFAHLMFNKNMDVGIKAGYIFDTVTTKNEEGDKSAMSFTRNAIEVFSHTWIGRHGLGGGVSYHLNPSFQSNNSDNKAHYHNAIGAYADYFYHFVDTGTALGLKYSRIHYKNKETDRLINGSGWGISFSQLF